ncbi:MAG: hypothetical protein ACOZCO_14335 [Bacteroidota bacterium]
MRNFYSFYSQSKPARHCEAWLCRLKQSAGVLAFIFLFSCGTTSDTVKEKSSDMEGKTITVTGKAQNHKDGATLHTADGVYYLENLHSWNDAEIDKEFTITGTVKTEKREYVNSDPEKGIISQGVPQPEGSKEKYYTVTWLVKWEKKQ